MNNYVVNVNSGKIFAVSIGHHAFIASVVILIIYFPRLIFNFLQKKQSIIEIND